MKDMFMVKVHVTPEMANELLAKNKHNRKVNRLVVEQMVADIKCGKFELTHQPIAIAEDGELIDGQHRLTAISESGMAVDLYIAYNAQRSTKIDIGRTRDIRTSLYMAGIVEKDSIEYNRATYPLIKMAASIQYGVAFTRRLTAEEIHNAYVLHHETLDPIIKMIVKRSKINVPVASSVLAYSMLCAYNSGVPIDTLRDWYNILVTGDIVVENDTHTTRVKQSVLIFAKWATGKRIDVWSQADEREEYIKKAMSSISHFRNKDIITKLYGEYCYKQYLFRAEDFNNASDKTQAV